MFETFNFQILLPFSFRKFGRAQILLLISFLTQTRAAWGQAGHPQETLWLGLGRVDMGGAAGEGKEATASRSKGAAAAGGA